MKEFLFVYGTLRPPKTNSRPVDSFNYPKIETFVQSIQPAELFDAVLFDFGSFPGARPGVGVIIGEVLEIQYEALAVTDPLEGHPELYYRERVTVKTETGSIQAWIYWAPGEAILTGPVITNGDWLGRYLG